jgi:hypothetical protein
MRTPKRVSFLGADARQCAPAATLFRGRGFDTTAKTQVRSTLDDKRISDSKSEALG